MREGRPRWSARYGPTKPLCVKWVCFGGYGRAWRAVPLGGGSRVAWVGLCRSGVVTRSKSRCGDASRSRGQCLVPACPSPDFLASAGVGLESTVDDVGELALERSQGFLFAFAFGLGCLLTSLIQLARRDVGHPAWVDAKGD